MKEYFMTECPEWKDLNGREIKNKRLANADTIELYEQTVYEITFENGHSMIAYPEEIVSENEMKGNN